MIYPDSERARLILNDDSVWEYWVAGGCSGRVLSKDKVVIAVAKEFRIVRDETINAICGMVNATLHRFNPPRDCQENITQADTALAFAEIFLANIQRLKSST